MGMISALRDRFFPTPIEAPADPLDGEHRRRRELFALYWDYYRGEHQRPLKTTPDNPDDNVTLNLSRKVINRSVDFLFGKPVEFEIDGEEERSEEEKYLDWVWADDPLNDFSKGDWLQGLAQNGAVCGHPFIRIYPGQGKPGQADAVKPRLVNLDPALVDVVTDPDDKSQVLEYHIVWQVGEDWKRDRISRLATPVGPDDPMAEVTWTIAREVWTSGDEGWQLEEPDEDAGEENPIAWDYPFPPIFEAQNLKNTQSFWGISELEDCDVNDAINFNASNVNRILRFHAHPKTVAIGISAHQIKETSVSGLWALPGQADKARIQNLEMQSDLASSREYLKDLRANMHEVTDTPDLDPTQVQVGALSGFALRILYGPLLSKTESKRRRYGGLLSRINYALLVLAELEADRDNPPKCKWQNPLPENELEKAQIFGLLAQASGNVFAAAKAAGYNAEIAQELSEVDLGAFAGLTPERPR